MKKVATEREKLRRLIQSVEGSANLNVAEKQRKLLGILMKWVREKEELRKSVLADKIGIDEFMIDYVEQGSRKADRKYAFWIIEFFEVEIPDLTMGLVQYLTDKSFPADKSSDSFQWKEKRNLASDLQPRFTEGKDASPRHFRKSTRKRSFGKGKVQQVSSYY